MHGKKTKVSVTSQERLSLESIRRQHHIPRSLYQRASIILYSDEGHRFKWIAEQLGIHPNIVTNWAKRWAQTSDSRLTVVERLSDLPRSGAPNTFTSEQMCQIIALACEDPGGYDLPITHWTHEELAAAAIKQGIVTSISSSHVGRILQQFEIQPHRSRYWLNAQPDEKKTKKSKTLPMCMKKPARILNRRPST